LEDEQKAENGNKCRNSKGLNRGYPSGIGEKPEEIGLLDKSDDE
jgi:hypothetical protein